MDHSARDHNAYACRLYVHKQEAARFLLVCEALAFPRIKSAHDWDLVVMGFDPPNRVKPWLKLNGYHQIWMDGGIPPDEEQRSFS